MHRKVPPEVDSTCHWYIEEIILYLYFAIAVCGMSISFIFRSFFLVLTRRKGIHMYVSVRMHVFVNMYMCVSASVCCCVCVGFSYRVDGLVINYLWKWLTCFLIYGFWSRMMLCVLYEIDDIAMFEFTFLTRW